MLCADGSTNHKPEIAVCLSDRFLGFAGIRPLAQARALVGGVKEVRDLPNEVKDAVNAFVHEPHGAHKGDWETTRSLFEQFILMDGEEVKSAVSAFADRVKKEGSQAFEGVGEDVSDEEKERFVEAVKVLDEYNRGDGAIFASL